MNIFLSSTFFLLAARETHALDGSLSAGFFGTNQSEFFNAIVCFMLLVIDALTILFISKLVDGNIFEIKTKTHAVSIKRLDIHMVAATHPIQVWYRPGNQSPVYVETYENAFDADVTGIGPNVATPLPAFHTPIVIPANTTYTFYVTTSQNGALALYYEFGTLLGQAYVSDDFLDINEGYQMRYSFSSPGQPRKWNGEFKQRQRSAQIAMTN
jgi:hypothetical protein